MSGFIWAVNGGGDIVALPDPLNAYRRPSLVGTSWNEVRLGILYTWVPTVSSDAACSAESITAASCLDWFTLGLKDSSDLAPGRAGASFIGFCFPGTTATYTVSITSNAAGTGTLATSSNHSYIASVYGTSLLSADNIATVFTVQYPIFSLTSVCAFLGLKLVVNNAGASNQSITCTMYSNTAGNTADMSVNNLRTQIFNVAYATSGTINWNSGGVALPLPTYWYLRLPFNLSRIKITAMEMFKIS